MRFIGLPLSLMLLLFVCAVPQTVAGDDSAVVAVGELGCAASRSVDPVLAQLSVETSAPPHRAFPVQLALDGNVDSAPFWDSGSAVDGITYTFTMERPTLVNQVGFIQDRRYPALSYRLLGRTVGSEEFDLVLAVVDDHSARGSVWLVHEFAPVALDAIQLQPTVGYGLAGRPFPRIAHFTAGYSDLPLVETKIEPLRATVDLNRTLSLNGYTQIHDSMFSVAEATWMSDELAEDLLAPLNFGMVSHWPFYGWNDPDLIPEDPNNPGHFDRSFIEAGHLQQWAEFMGWAPGGGMRIERLLRDELIGAWANVGLITAPAYMRDVTSYTPTIMADEQRQVGDNWQRMAPPRDPQEWGKWIGEIVRALNDASGGVIRSVYIWNEPNTHWYWPVPWGEKAPWYVRTYIEAVPEIKKRNPGILVGGPVFSGAGVLVRDGHYRHFDDWIRPLIDARLLDFLDVHTYRVHPQSIPAEMGMVAAYAQAQGAPIPPILSSEGGFSAAGLYQHEAVHWRYSSLHWLDYLLMGLEHPDTVLGQSYFFVYGDSHPPGLFATRASRERTSMYWMYWVLRNVRGQRLVSWTDAPAQEAQIVASHAQDQSVVFIRDRSELQRELELQLKGLPLEEDIQVRVDYVEYDGGKMGIVHGTRSLQVEDGLVRLKLEPNGLYAVTITPIQLDPSTTLERQSLRSETINQLLSRRHAITVEIPGPEVLDKVSSASLTFGVGNIPFYRQEMLETYALMEISLNGHTFSAPVQLYNEFPIDPELLQETNELTLQLLIPSRDEPMARVTNDMFLLFAAIDIWQVR